MVYLGWQRSDSATIGIREVAGNVVRVALLKKKNPLPAPFIRSRHLATSKKTQAYLFSLVLLSLLLRTAYELL